MMPMRRERAFKNRIILQTMIAMRLQGWPLKELAIIFRADHTSVRKACLRNGLPPEVPLLERPLIVFKSVVYDFDGERINQGKNYLDYLADAERKRQLRKY